MAEIGELPVEPDTVARVVIDSRTGTVVIGQDVQISTVAVTHGTLSVRVNETPVASQPAPFSQGKTVEQPRTEIDAQQEGGQVAIVGGSSLRTLVSGLNRNRRQAERHHRHPSGDQDRRRAAGRSRRAVGRVSPAQGAAGRLSPFSVW